MSEKLEEALGEFELCVSEIGEKQKEFLSVISHSSTKLNNTNREKLRKFNLDVVDQAVIQNIYSCKLFVRLCCRTELVEFYVSRKEVFSYAEVF